jgi:hypothetical protein
MGHTASWRVSELAGQRLFVAAGWRSPWAKVAGLPPSSQMLSVHGMGCSRQETQRFLGLGDSGGTLSALWGTCRLPTLQDRSSRFPISDYLQFC